MGLFTDLIGLAIDIAIDGITGIVVEGSKLIIDIWRHLTTFFSRLFDEIISRLKKIAHGIQVLVKRVKAGIHNFIQKTFYKENGKWIQETTITEIEEDEVPPHIRKKVNSQEKDITEDMALELDMEL